MICDYNDEYILELLFGQLQLFKLTNEEEEKINKIFLTTKKRIITCFFYTENKYYHKNGDVYFNPFHSGQWCIFLYYLSNSLFKESISNRILCDKIYYLNRMLNSCDMFYEVNLPDIFFLDHPLGAVIGRGSFSNNFSFSQGCTIGNNTGIFPKLGENVAMFSNSKVIGNSNIGNNVIIAANTYIKDTDIPDDSIVFGTSPNLIIKKNKNL
jgi:serine O-acetyltransferase